ncbi:probable 3-hydroxyisobutyrate dehydrogenase-like 1, mitochondrial [Nicotiana sylvestris]|uniref:Probable 3-hydroxyisobutyrate dehydrogenase-like 1, mitochondrial n=1 Tax=Nicotiana sylvestris TaxID=4096 RepID=A0A1U7V6Q4_NICSY|nr:PREDICTED: probable 3-hydroxyisobutyrate dehydrogenase-like 1, mitochondrial [Nicotiana sylvestris]
MRFMRLLRLLPNHQFHCYVPQAIFTTSAGTTTHLHRTMETATTEAINPSNTRLGWIGTGVMGRSMCAHLINAGYTLTVFTRTPSKAQELISMGAHWVASPKAVASQSDVVFSIVGYPSDVRHVILDSNSGALSGLRPGGVIIDMTTSEPSLAVEIYSAASAAGCSAVDAPVSGGDLGARNAALSIFAGGEESIISRLNPLFNLVGRVYYMGAPGKGQFTKLGNQVVIASTMVGLCEGLIYAHKAGLDLNMYLNAISTGAAGSKSLDLYGSRILSRDFEPGFYVNHFVKDLGICLRECQNMGLALPGLALAQQLYLSLKAHGEGNFGTQALILALERINNLPLASSSSVGKP